MICYRQNLTIHYESHDSLGSGFVLSLKETGGIPKRFVIFIELGRFSCVYSQDQFLECPISANRFLVYSITSVSVCSLVVLSCTLNFFSFLYVHL